MLEECVLCHSPLEFYEKEICFECEQWYYDPSFEDDY